MIFLLYNDIVHCLSELCSAIVVCAAAVERSMAFPNWPANIVIELLVNIMKLFNVFLSFSCQT